MASKSPDEEVWIWEKQTSKPVRALQRTGARSVAFSPDGRSLAVLSPGRNYPAKLIHVFEVFTGKRLARLPYSDAHRFTGMALWPWGKTIVSVEAEGSGLLKGDGGGTVKIWDLQTGRCLHAYPLEGPSAPFIRSTALSCDGRMLVTGGIDQTVRLWELATGKEIFATVEDMPYVTAVALSPDGRVIAWASRGDRSDQVGKESKIWLWDAVTSRPIRYLEGHASTITSLAFSPDGSRLASGLENSTVLLWDVVTGMRIPQWERFGYGPNGLETLWSDLASEDPRQAYQAIHILAVVPSQTVPFLADHLQPVAETVPPQRQTLRVLRAIHVLERIGTPEAQQVLRKLATGPAAVRETQDAKDVLERLATPKRITPNSSWAK